MSALKKCVAVAALLGLTGTAHSALFHRGGGMVYDSTLDITWLADWNLVGHQMQWATAKDWASNLVHGGYDDWRLPAVVQPDESCSHNSPQPGLLDFKYYGFTCMASEMSHLFYADLGGKTGEAITEQAGDTPQELASLALFSNMQYGAYWAGTTNAANPASAWYFSAMDGGQNTGLKNLPMMYAVAVRPGDVTSTLPEAQTLLLVLLALGAAATVRATTD